MVQTIARRKHLMFKPKIIIVDEAHHVPGGNMGKSIPDVARRQIDWSHRHAGKVGRQGIGRTSREISLRAGNGELAVDNLQGDCNGTINPATGLPVLAPVRTLRIPSSLVLDGVAHDKNGEYRWGNDISTPERITGAVIAAMQCEPISVTPPGNAPYRPIFWSSPRP